MVINILFFLSLQSILLSHSITLLWNHAILEHQKLVDETKCISKLLPSLIYPRSNSNFYSDYIHSHFSNSQVEITMEQHTNTSPQLVSQSKPLVIKEDRKRYPKNPTNTYISRYSDDFFGCLSYGSSNRMFK